MTLAGMATYHREKARERGLLGGNHSSEHEISALSTFSSLTIYNSYLEIELFAGICFTVLIAYLNSTRSSSYAAGYSVPS